MDIYPYLFEDFAYNMPKIEVVEKSGAGPCPGFPNNRLMFCAPKPAVFLGREWQEMFSFNNEEQLQQVILTLQDKNPESYQQITACLREKGWQPVFLEMDGDAFDWLFTKKHEDGTTADQKLKEFETKALAGEDFLSVYFFPANFVKKCLETGVKTWTQAVDSASEDFCMIQLSIDNDNLKLFFTAPLLSRKNALRYGGMIKRK